MKLKNNKFGKRVFNRYLAANKLSIEVQFIPNENGSMLYIAYYKKMYGRGDKQQKFWVAKDGASKEANCSLWTEANSLNELQNKIVRFFTCDNKKERIYIVVPVKFTKRNRLGKVGLKKVYIQTYSEF